MASEPYTAEAPPVIVSTPLEDELRNQIDVDDGIRIRQRQAPPIEQHEIARLAEAAQIQRRASRERHGADVLASGPARTAATGSAPFDVDRAGSARSLLRRTSRSGLVEEIVRARDARTGDHDLLDFREPSSAPGAAVRRRAARDRSEHHGTDRRLTDSHFIAPCHVDFCRDSHRPCVHGERSRDLSTLVYRSVRTSTCVSSRVWLRVAYREQSCDVDMYELVRVRSTARRPHKP